MNLEVILGVWAGLYLDGETVSEGDLQPYVDDVLHELEFLTVSAYHQVNSPCKMSN